MAWVIVTKEEAANYLGVDDQTVIDDTWSDIVEDLIFERWKYDYGQTSYTELYDGTGKNYLRLDKSPIVSVTSVKFLATNGEYLTVTNNTIATYNYYIRLTSGGVFPEGIQNIEVTYTAGTDTIPAKLKFAELSAISYIWRFMRSFQGDDSLRFGNAPTEGDRDAFRRPPNVYSKVKSVIETIVPRKVRIS